MTLCQDLTTGLIETMNTLDLFKSTSTVDNVTGRVCAVVVVVVASALHQKHSDVIFEAVCL